MSPDSFLFTRAPIPHVGRGSRPELLSRVVCALLVVLGGLVTSVALDDVAAAAPGAGHCTRLAWTGSEDPGAVPHVWVHEGAGTARTGVTVGGGIRDAGTPNLGASGEMIAFAATEAALEPQPTHIRVGRPLPGAHEIVSDDGITPVTGAWSPALSPDGTAVAWVGSTPGREGAVFVRDLDGSLIQLPGSTAADRARDLVWSPDGERLAWHSGISAPAGTWLWSADGGVVDLAETAGAIAAPHSFSPDGRHLLLDSASGVLVVDVETMELTDLASGLGRVDIEVVGWAPDGLRVAAESADSGRSEVFVVDLDGNETVPIPREAEESQTHARWSPTGEQLVWASPLGIEIVNIETGDREMIATTDARIVDIHGWSSDGRSVAWSELTTTGPEVYIADVEPPAGPVVEASRGIVVPLPSIPFFDFQDPYDNVEADWSAGFTRLDASFELDGPAVQVEIRNLGDCEAQPIVRFGPGCTVVDERADFVAGHAHIPAGRIEPGSTIEMSVAVADCSAEIAVLAANSAPVLVRLVGPDVGGQAGGPDGTGCAEASTPFVDVAGSFAEGDIACIFGLGITTGTSATTFSPGDSVTREQMAAFLARTIRLGPIN